MKKGLLIAIAVLLAFLVLYPLIRFTIYQSSVDAAPITDLENYQNKSSAGWVSDDPYMVFPEEAVVSQANAKEYLFKQEVALFPVLFDDDIVAYLKCEFPSQTYLEEKERLSRLCGETDETHYCLPAYAYARGGIYYQYSLIDDESCTIYYIAFQNSSFAEKYIEKALLPTK